MGEQVIINNYVIQAERLDADSAGREQCEPGKREVSIDFQVTHDEYHAVTMLLYENDFIVEVPSKKIKFPAVIRSYSTSVTNLYKENSVGDFKLVLQEKA